MGGWGERRDHPAGTDRCCRLHDNRVCDHGNVAYTAADVDEARSEAATSAAEVADLSARLAIREVDAAPALAWAPATRMVRTFTGARHDLSSADRDETTFLARVVDHQARALDIDLTDGRSGVAALAAVLAASEHVVMLGNHGRMDPAIAEGVRRVLVTTAIALATFAPDEVRHP